MKNGFGLTWNSEVWNEWKHKWEYLGIWIFSRLDSVFFFERSWTLKTVVSLRYCAVAIHLYSSWKISRILFDFLSWIDMRSCNRWARSSTSSGGWADSEDYHDLIKYIKIFQRFFPHAMNYGCHKKYCDDFLSKMFSKMQLSQRVDINVSNILHQNQYICTNKFCAIVYAVGEIHDLQSSIGRSWWFAGWVYSYMILTMAYNFVRKGCQNVSIVIMKKKSTFPICYRRTKMAFELFEKNSLLAALSLKPRVRRLL